MISCPTFLKTLNIDDFIEGLFDYFSFKVEAKNLAWHSYNYSKENIKKNLYKDSSWKSYQYQSKYFRKIDQDSLCYLSRSYDYIQKNEDGTYTIAILITYKSEKLGYFIFDHIFIEEIFIFINEVEKLLEAAAEQLHYCLEFAKLKEAAFLDDLTEFYNQRFLSEHLENIIRYHRIQKKEMSVLFIDLDHFKLINDNFGHMVGSQLLVEISRLIKSQFNPHDIGIRYGGDEFVIVLPTVGEKEAHKVAENIRRTIDQTDFIIDSRKIKITASIGLASYPKHANNSEQIIKIADQAMYDAKTKSRNTVFIAS